MGSPLWRNKDAWINSSDRQMICIMCAGQRISQEGSSPSGSRMERAISKGGGNASLAPKEDGEDRVSTARWNLKGLRRSTGL
jgi:hypothetical protein